MLAAIAIARWCGVLAGAMLYGECCVGEIGNAATSSSGMHNCMV